jgi:hypothetical protein
MEQKTQIGGIEDRGFLHRNSPGLVWWLYDRQEFRNPLSFCCTIFKTWLLIQKFTMIIEVPSIISKFQIRKRRKGDLLDYLSLLMGLSWQVHVMVSACILLTTSSRGD